MQPAPTLIALGGGGFSMEPENLALDRFVLERTGRDRPRVAFLAQASGERETYIEAFYRAFTKLGARPSHVVLPPRTPSPHLAGPAQSDATPSPADPHAHLAGVDAIYVGGGNTLRMLHLWADYDLEPLLRARWEGGTVIAGVSAGMICWFEQGLTDSIPGRLTAIPCLGWLKGSATPHFDGEAERRPTARARLGEGTMVPGIAADDGCALRFEGDRLVEVLSSRPTAAAYHLTRSSEGGDASAVLERRIAARLLPPVEGVRGEPQAPAP